MISPLAVAGGEERREFWVALDVTGDERAEWNDRASRAACVFERRRRE
jgi:hypothetical protein